MTEHQSLDKIFRFDRKEHYRPGLIDNVDLRERQRSPGSHIDA